MKGVIATRAPGVPVVDVSHGIPARNVLVGALVLRAAAPYFPRRDGDARALLGIDVGTPVTVVGR